MSEDVYTPIPVKGFSHYLINCAGKIYSLKSKRFISLQLNSDRYLRAYLWSKGKRCKFFVHRLVATIWCHNPNPRLYDQVDHIDTDRENNHHKNLQWVSCSQNLLLARERNRKKYISKGIYNHEASKLAAGTPF
jgi:hypothetical protein